MGEWSVFLPLERPSWDHISYRGLPRVRSGGRQIRTVCTNNEKNNGELFQPVHAGAGQQQAPHPHRECLPRPG